MPTASSGKAVLKSRDGQVAKHPRRLQARRPGGRAGHAGEFDSFGQRSVLTFTGFEVNAAVPASHFSFVPPKGATCWKQ